MKKSEIYKEEFKRAFFNKGMALALLVGTIVVLIYSYGFLKLHTWKNTENVILGYLPYRHNTATTFWIIVESNPYYYYICYLLPLIAVMPFGLSYLKEEKSGVIKNIFIRNDKKQYINRKFIVSFTAGGVSAIYIPLLSLLVILPYQYIQEPSSLLGGGFNSSFSCEMYFSNTVLFVLIFFMLYFLFGGLLSSISLMFSTFIKNRLTVFLIPFFLVLGILFVRNAMMNTDYSIMFKIICPYDFLHCKYSNGYVFQVMAGMMAITIVSYGVFRKCIMSKDVL